MSLDVCDTWQMEHKLQMTQHFKQLLFVRQHSWDAVCLFTSDTYGRIRNFDLLGPIIPFVGLHSIIKNNGNDMQIIEFIVSLWKKNRY